MADRTTLKLSLVLARKMTPEERARWKVVAKALPAWFPDTLPHQQIITDFVRANMELEKITPAYRDVLELTVKDPTNQKLVVDLKTWMGMVNKVEAKIERLRKVLGLSVEYEAKLRKAKNVKDGPPGSSNDKKHPWDKK